MDDPFKQAEAVSRIIQNLCDAALRASETGHGHDLAQEIAEWRKLLAVLRERAKLWANQ